MTQEKEYIYVGDSHTSTPAIEGISSVWTSVLRYGVLQASHFEARFPDDPALSEGKEEFLGLPKISVGPWSGMSGAIAVTGEMTPEAKALFLRIIDGGDIRLWDFVLFRNGKKLLSVSDYVDRIVTEHFAREFMEKLFQSCFEAIPEPAVEHGDGEAGGILETVRETIQEVLETDN